MILKTGIWKKFCIIITPPSPQVYSVFPSSMLQTVTEWLWWEPLWLPANVSWSDLEDKDGRVYAKASQLQAALPCALCMLLVRYLFERCDNKVCAMCASDLFNAIVNYLAHAAWRNTLKPKELFCVA